MGRLADQLKTVVGHHLNNVQVIVRDDAIYINANVTRSSHDVDWVDPGFRTLELTVQLK